MHNRLNQNDVTNRVNVEDAMQVRDTVVGIYASRYPGTDFTPLVRAFDDVHALFLGRYPGYLPCDTLYHDMRHTLDMTLAMARLIDGYDRAHPAGDRLGPRRAILGAIVALLHDSGYMKRTSEAAIANGAEFTKVHVSRSADFVLQYLPRVGFSAESGVAAQLVHFTGYELEIEDIRVDDPLDRMLGYMVGTADLIGQMSDRMYLEKCRDFLYQEFVVGGVARETLPDGREIVRYTSGDDLIYKTPGFCEYVARDRINRKLGAVDRYAASHFDGPNLYTAEIQHNVDYLQAAIEEANLARLRRTCYSLSARSLRAA